MANTPKVLTDVRLFTGGCDLTTANNKIEFTAEVDEKDVTTFGSAGWNTVIGGIKKGKVAASGFWSAGSSDQVDDNLWPGMGGRGAWSWCPDTADVADIAYLTYGLQANYKILDGVGEVAPWSADMSSAWPISRGVVLHPPGTARTATGSGTAVEHVAVTSGQYVYGNLHVLSVSGTSTPTITVTVQSDDNSGFTSATTRATFTAATAVGGESIRAAGAITDTWWRVGYTIAGTNPSFLFTVTLGVI
jgi:hypothetical protein